MRAGLLRPARRPSIHLDVELVKTVSHRPEQCRNLRVFDRFTAHVAHQVLLRHISNIVGRVVFSQQMVKRQFLGWPHIFGNTFPPLLRVCEFRIDIKNHAPERVLAMANNLSNRKLRICGQHLGLLSPHDRLTPAAGLGGLPGVANSTCVCKNFRGNKA